MIVTIFYNELNLSETPYLIHPNCPSVNVRFEGAEDFAKKQVESGVWTSYLIPDLTTEEFIYEL